MFNIDYAADGDGEGKHDVEKWIIVVVMLYSNHICTFFTAI